MKTIYPILIEPHKEQEVFIDAVQKWRGGIAT